MLAAFANVTVAQSAAAPFGAAPPAKPEILVLGTFHMANPGSDVHNAQVDDVLSARRQREMAELLAVLKRFRPTKIAVEANVNSQRTSREYAEYLAGRYTLTRNEVDQIGFRLAKELDHPTVYAVDASGDYPYMRVLNYAKANGRQAEFDTMANRVGERVKADADYLRAHTLLETLAHINADSSVTKWMASDFDYVPFGEPWEYAGSDLLGSWFQRNARIYRNILALATAPDDRLLVVYGSGHLGWLRQMVQAHGRATLRTLADLR